MNRLSLSIPGLDEGPDGKLLVRHARREFRKFYSLAKPDEKELMDTLVRLHAAASLATTVPLKEMSPDIRKVAKKMLDEVEKAFNVQKEKVRNSLAFSRLSSDEQSRIARRLFEALAPPKL